jgi:pimeloyl-ACP methyl ester carboxylesterase
VQRLTTSILDIAFETGGPALGPVVLLLHGWPDDATTWGKVTPGLNAAGFRTIAPWLRGFGPTRLLSEAIIRDGRIEALAQDAIDLMDGLEVERFAVVGHDWGARAAYALAAIIPERIVSIAALSLGYSPGGAFPVPRFEQSRAWWYQWFMSVDRGAKAIADNPKGFARIQWDTWSPSGWFSDADFEEVARSFENPDWLAITLNSYRNRWRDEVHDPRYGGIQERLAKVEILGTPTLMIQGAEDRTVLPPSTEGKDRYFSAFYKRMVLEGVGHFPTREAPETTTAALLDHLGAFAV